jgi:hypothetical protein
MMNKVAYMTVASMNKKITPQRAQRTQREIYIVFNPVFSVNSVARVCLVFLRSFASLHEMVFMEGISNE